MKFVVPFLHVDYRKRSTIQWDNIVHHHDLQSQPMEHWDIAI